MIIDKDSGKFGGSKGKHERRIVCEDPWCGCSVHAAVEREGRAVNKGCYPALGPLVERVRVLGPFGIECPGYAIHETVTDGDGNLLDRVGYRDALHMYETVRYEAETDAIVLAIVLSEPSSLADILDELEARFGLEEARRRLGLKVADPLAVAESRSYQKLWDEGGGDLPDIGRFREGLE